MTTTYEPTAEEAEQWQQDHITVLAETLKQIDIALTDASNALHHVREVRRAAKGLDEQQAKRVAIRTYDRTLEDPWEPKSTDLGLAESAQASLAGAYLEPVRDLIAATHASEALLVSFASQAEEDRHRIERELVALRG